MLSPVVPIASPVLTDKKPESHGVPPKVRTTPHAPVSIPIVDRNVNVCMCKNDEFYESFIVVWKNLGAVQRQDVWKICPCVPVRTMYAAGTLNGCGAACPCLSLWERWQREALTERVDTLRKYAGGIFRLSKKPVIASQSADWRGNPFPKPPLCKGR